MAEFQAGAGLAVDGIAGHETCAAKGCLPGHSGAALAAAGPVDRSATRAPATIDSPAADSIEESRSTLPLPVQQKAVREAAEDDAQTQQIAARGVAGSGGAIPHVDRIAQSFGPEHAGSVQGIRAHVGGDAATAAHDIGALAYASGDSVAFASSPDLHTAAHEAAHVVQQKAGVSLKGGVGQVGDPYEQHADAVADAVVRGESAAPILAQTPTGTARTGVQRFVEPEHKELCDVGSGGQTYKFGNQEFTHGDIVMLSGDHFSPDELVTLLQTPSKDPDQQPGTQDELIYALKDNLGTADPRESPRDLRRPDYMSPATSARLAC